MILSPWKLGERDVGSFVVDKTNNGKDFMVLLHKFKV